MVDELLEQNSGFSERGFGVGSADQLEMNCGVWRGCGVSQLRVGRVGWIAFLAAKKTAQITLTSSTVIFGHSGYH